MFSSIGKKALHPQKKKCCVTIPESCAAKCDYRIWFEFSYSTFFFGDATAAFIVFGLWFYWILGVEEHQDVAEWSDALYCGILPRWFDCVISPKGFHTFNKFPNTFFIVIIGMPNILNYMFSFFLSFIHTLIKIFVCLSIAYIVFFY